jgi:hypothetical protein
MEYKHLMKLIRGYNISKLNYEELIYEIYLDNIYFSCFDYNQCLDYEIC